MSKVILIGGFSEIIELCESAGITISGIIDNKLKNKYYGYKIIGTDNDAHSMIKKIKNNDFIITPDMPELRVKLFEKYNKYKLNFINLISKKAFISKTVKIGKGIVIQSFVNVSSNTILGSFIKINTYANVMHDTIIGDFTTIAPNAVILGRVKIGQKCYIGSNSTILPHIKIGNNVIVGAGAVVTKNVKDNSIIVGNPARKLMK
jgi:sugar O-acyltransferase (sialic acid O-acetyltransferase NeuD family)